MKIDLLHIGSLTIHGYGFMIGIGILCCLMLATKRAKVRGMSEDAVIDIAIWGVVIGFLGAKLLYVIVEFDRFLKDPRAILGSEGFVVYGGIITGVIVAIVYCRIKKLRFIEYFDLLVPSVAMAQGFGRIGCFLAGCCYGKETHSSIGVIFPPDSLAPAGIRLLPTQLFSSLGNFIIMGILLWYAKRAKCTGDVSVLYMILYAVGRFFIEFLRNDDRGSFLMFTTSQWISVFILLFAVILRHSFHKKTEVPPVGTSAI